MLFFTECGLENFLIRLIVFHFRVQTSIDRWYLIPIHRIFRVRVLEVVFVDLM